MQPAWRAEAVLGSSWFCLQKAAPLLSFEKGEPQVLASPPLPSRPAGKQLWPKHEGQVSWPRPCPLRWRAGRGMLYGGILLLWAWCRVISVAVRLDTLNYYLEPCRTPSTGYFGLNSLLSCGDIDCKINFSSIPDSFKVVVGLCWVGCGQVESTWAGSSYV